MRDRCAAQDPSRANRLRHPAVRLYGEYLLGYVGAIRRAPLSPADRKECYQHLARWAAGRALPVAGRVVSRSGLQNYATGATALADPIDISVDALVAGRVEKHS